MINIGIISFRGIRETSEKFCSLIFILSENWGEARLKIAIDNSLGMQACMCFVRSGDFVGFIEVGADLYPEAIRPANLDGDWG